ncbi:MAG: hypothetical protein ABJ004_02650 [Cyclobacteriaceae bacterium]
MSRPFIFFAICSVLAVASCSDDKVIKKCVVDYDTLGVIDSTLIYPKCIPEASGAAQFGCNNMFFGRVLDENFRDATKIVTVTIDPSIITVTKFCQEFELPIEGIDIKYQVSRMHPDSVYFNFCNDVIYENEGQPLSYSAKSGYISVVSSIDTVITEPMEYYISARLSNLLFFLNEQKDTIISDVIISKRRQGAPY